MNKNDLREAVMANDSTITIGDVKFNDGKIYNPRVNSGRGYTFVGEDWREKIVNALWRQAQTYGGFTYKGKTYGR